MNPWEPTEALTHSTQGTLRAGGRRMSLQDRRGSSARPTTLERLCRYVGRPPLPNDRLEERADGRLTLRLKTRWRDGTTHIRMERSELIELLVPLIPPPRAHQTRYHGVLAPAASPRAARPGSIHRPTLQRSSPDQQPAPALDPRAEARRMRWARLRDRRTTLSALWLVAAIKDPAVARKTPRPRSTTRPSPRILGSAVTRDARRC